MKNTLRPASRGSKLALWQTHWVESRLKEHFPELEIPIEVISTKGDRVLDKPLVQLGKGSFTKELDRALLDGRADLAVHSLKDLPTSVPEGLVLAAVSERGEDRDAFISADGTGLADLPKGAKIATGSLRRRAFLHHYRRDLDLVDIRGNVDTRLKKLEESDWHGIILAAVGLERLGLAKVITEKIGYDVSLPAVGQGFLGVICREDDGETREILATAIDDTSAHREAAAERAFLATLEGGCQVPIGARANTTGDELALVGAVLSLDGTRMVRQSMVGSAGEAPSLGRELAENILDRGGREILDEIRRSQEVELP